MTKIRPNIYLGHEYDAHMDAVRINGITACLNVADDLNDPLYPRQKLLTCKVGLSDDLYNSSGMIGLAESTLSYLINMGHTVLIHCRAGMSRSPYILALYLAKTEQRSYEEVWQELKHLRKELPEKSKLCS